MENKTGAALLVAGGLYLLSKTKKAEAVAEAILAFPRPSPEAVAAGVVTTIAGPAAVELTAAEVATFEEEVRIASEAAIETVIETPVADKPTSTIQLWDKRTETYRTWPVYWEPAINMWMLYAGGIPYVQPPRPVGW